MTKRKKFGVGLLVGPYALMIFTLVCYSVMTFVFSAVAGATESSSAIVIGQVVSLLLSMAGIIALLGIIIGGPVGLYFLLTEPKKKKEKK